jgi:hypothetical protein
MLPYFLGVTSETQMLPYFLGVTFETQMLPHFLEVTFETQILLYFLGVTFEAQILPFIHVLMEAIINWRFYHSIISGQMLPRGNRVKFVF